MRPKWIDREGMSPSLVTGGLIVNCSLRKLATSLRRRPPDEDAVGLVLDQRLAMPDNRSLPIVRH